MTQQAQARFFPADDLSGDGLELVLVDTLPGDVEKGWMPSYCFEIRKESDTRTMGDICLRLGDERMARYEGHISFEIHEDFRGHNYAARAARLLWSLAKAHGMNRLLICVGSANAPARRATEKLGAVYLDTIAVPEDHPLRLTGAQEKARYVWEG